MAINAIRNLSSQWYEPERDMVDNPEDLDESNLSSFEIKPLNGSQAMAVVYDQSIEGYKKAIRYGLKDWKNFADGEKFSMAKAFEIIPTNCLMKIAERIVEISDITGKQQKNS